MQKIGTTNLPLHYGSCPRWLFSRMVQLGGAISEAIIYEYGQEEYLKRVSNPYFFQAFGCALAFDWNSSGLSTTLCGALKVAINENDFGLKIAGGKGKTSRETPRDIEKLSTNFGLSTAKVEKLKYSSRIAARVDNNLVQDGYQLYMHTFFFTEKGKYAVVQQGLSNKNCYARRYHWLSDDVKDYVEEPHTAICCNKKEPEVLNLTAKESKGTREISLDLVKDNPKHLEKYLVSKDYNTLLEYFKDDLVIPRRHSLTEKDLSKKVLAQLKKAYEIQPKDYEELVSLEGIGAKSLRALALISELIYGTKASWNDPNEYNFLGIKQDLSSVQKFAFAHGGKDGHPYFPEKNNMDNSINTLKCAIKNAKIGDKNRLDTLRKLREFVFDVN